MNGKKGCQILRQVSQRRSEKTCLVDAVSRIGSTKLTGFPASCLDSIDKDVHKETCQEPRKSEDYREDGISEHLPVSTRPDESAMIPSRNFHYRLSADPRILLAPSEPSSAIHDSEHVCHGRQNLSHGRKTPKPPLCPASLAMLAFWCPRRRTSRPYFLPVGNRRGKAKIFSYPQEIPRKSS
jgi:hypothetical protein